MANLKDFFDFSEEKTKSYEFRNYSDNVPARDILEQIINSTFGPKASGDLLEKLGNLNAWAIPVEELKNIAVKFFNGDNTGDAPMMELTYHTFEWGNRQDPNMREEMEEKCTKFLSECEKLIKKEFKSRAGAALKIKKVNKKDIFALEQVTFGMPFVSFVGAYPDQANDRYYLTCRRIYNLNSE